MCIMLDKNAVYLLPFPLEILFLSHGLPHLRFCSSACEHGNVLVSAA